MKDLSYSELVNAPSIIQYIYIASVQNQPIGMSIYEEAMKSYPQFFKEELELRRRWDAVPEHIKEQYFDAMAKMYKTFDEKTPFHGKGIMFFANNPDKFSQQMFYVESQRPLKIDEGKKIHNQFLSSFGIQFNEQMI